LPLASRLAERLGNIYFTSMGSPCSQVLIIALAMIAVGAADTASTQLVPNIMVDVDKNGNPIVMKGSRAQEKTPESEDRPSNRAERPRRIPRGSSAYVEPIPLPNTGRSSGIVAPPPVTTYNPPPINNPSERINQLNQSFPLNRGLGNNPTGRGGYLRYNLNR
jgi:hypothetical protein